MPKISVSTQTVSGAVFIRLLCGGVVYSLLLCGSHGNTTLLKVQIFASVCMPHFSQKLMHKSVPVADATEAALVWGTVDAEIRFLLLSYPGSVNPELSNLPALCLQ